MFLFYVFFFLFFFSLFERVLIVLFIVLFFYLWLSLWKCLMYVSSEISFLGEPTFFLLFFFNFCIPEDSTVLWQRKVSGDDSLGNYFSHFKNNFFNFFKNRTSMPSPSCEIAEPSTFYSTSSLLLSVVVPLLYAICKKKKRCCSFLWEFAWLRKLLSFKIYFELR